MLDTAYPSNSMSPACGAQRQMRARLKQTKQRTHTFNMYAFQASSNQPVTVWCILSSLSFPGLQQTRDYYIFPATVNQLEDRRPIYPRSRYTCSSKRADKIN